MSATTWKIDYSYACWKCPQRHDGVYQLVARNRVRAMDAWLSDMAADHGATFDYELKIKSLKKIEGGGSNATR